MICKKIRIFNFFAATLYSLIMYKELHIAKNRHCEKTNQTHRKAIQD